MRRRCAHGCCRTCSTGASPVPRVQPDRVVKGDPEASVYIANLYDGPGLKGIPKGEVKALRLYTYTYGFEGEGGLYGVIGMDGPWDMRRILGTVPVEAATVLVPARSRTNTTDTTATAHRGTHPITGVLFAPAVRPPARSRDWTSYRVRDLNSGRGSTAEDAFPAAAASRSRGSSSRACSG